MPSKLPTPSQLAFVRETLQGRLMPRLPAYSLYGAYQVRFLVRQTPVGPIAGLAHHGERQEP